MPLVCLSGCFPDATSASEPWRPLLCYFFKNSLIFSTTTLGKIKKKWGLSCVLFCFFFLLQTPVLEMRLCHVKWLHLAS